MEPGLRTELAHARRQTDCLFDLVSPETLYARPVAERHRLIFYLGHFEAFDWNVLARRATGEKAFHAEFDRLFERGIDPAPGHAPADTVKDWPGIDEVKNYGAKTREWVDRHFDELDPRTAQMAIEHRHMHAETFAYLLHNLPYEAKRGPRAAGSPRVTETPRNRMIGIEAGAVTLGGNAEGFGWDNEHLAHRVDVAAFRISKLKISNGEYLEFVREGGPAPRFWTRAGGEWMLRGMFGTIPLPLDGPAWVTWSGADAYARWHGMALASEAQWQRAAALTTPDAARDNFGFVRWDPIAVNAGAGNGNGRAPWQMVGNGWEWTRDVFAPFEGFAPHPFYPGYSADFFDGGHYVMKGASPRTARLLTRPAFRNWFRPDYPHMYAGFRVVEN